MASEICPPECEHKSTFNRLQIKSINLIIEVVMLEEIIREFIDPISTDKLIKIYHQMIASKYEQRTIVYNHILHVSSQCSNVLN